MADQKADQKKEEMEILTVQDLDVAELERRLEMAATPITPDGWLCDCNENCLVNIG